jgi:hypothetical protein
MSGGSVKTIHPGTTYGGFSVHAYVCASVCGTVPARVMQMPCQKSDWRFRHKEISHLVTDESVGTVSL